MGFLKCPKHMDLTLLHANNKGADQLPYSLSYQRLSFHSMERVIPELAICKNFNMLASLCSLSSWFESHLVVKPEDRFSRTKAHLMGYKINETEYDKTN